MIKISLESDNRQVGRAAATTGAAALREAIRRNGTANIVIATGASQIEMLAMLTTLPDIDWSCVTAFHLDEYIGMPEIHPASFRRYLKERFTEVLPDLREFHFIAGDAPDLSAELDRINGLAESYPIDVTFAGIGENGHLAFNDPPADFTTTDAYKIVQLDDRCRRQQFNEGWFPSLKDVPHQAISMTVPQILKSRSIILAVPDRRKAEAVRATLEGPLTPNCPASILQQHAACHLFLDPESASLLKQATVDIGI